MIAAYQLVNLYGAYLFYGVIRGTINKNCLMYKKLSPSNQFEASLEKFPKLFKESNNF